MVIDWGLAVDLREGPADVRITRATVMGEIVGTPAYMPLEQASGGAVDERADVYAIGAVLYNLFAGVAPYAGSSSLEVAAAVIDAPPPPLASRAPEVPADLLAIVDKAMARLPADRYVTAGELAADLKRFSAGQLVGAHHYSLSQLLARWMRKHRTALAVAAVAFVALSVIGVVSVREIVVKKHLAEHRRATAQGLVAFMLGELEQKLEPIGKLDLLYTVANKARDYYQNEPGDVTPEDQHQRVLARRILGDVLAAKGHLAEALVEYRASLAIATDRYVAASTNVVAQRDLSASHDNVGDVLANQGDLAAALVEYRASLGIREKLVASDPTNTDAQRSLSLSYDHVGDVLAEQGDVAAALGEYRASLVISEKLAASDPTDANAQRDLSVSYNHVGDALAKRGDIAAALVEYRASVVIRKNLAASDLTSAVVQRDLSFSYDKVGDMLAKQGDTAAALAEYRASLAISEKLAAADPQRVDAQLDLFKDHARVGGALAASGDKAGALVEYRVSFAIIERAAAQHPTSTDLTVMLGEARALVNRASSQSHHR